MKTFVTFLRKEILEQIRTKKIMILGLLFIFFGILNPLTAKMTPWLLEVLSESMESSGINITVVEITALDSWVQFFKNMPMLLIIFILMQSNIFSKEYQNGTLTLVLTKGFERYKVLLSKIVVMLIVWTLGYLICYLITYIYNAYFWDNSIASNLFFSSLSWWIFGVFVVTLFMLLSVCFESSGSALALTGGIMFLLYLISLLPKINKYLPIILTDGNSLIYDLKNAEYYIPSLIITMCLSLILVLISVLTFNKKKV